MTRWFYLFISMNHICFVEKFIQSKNNDLVEGDEQRREIYRIGK